MKTTSLKSTPVINTFSFKSALSLLLQWIGAFIAFILSMIVANILSPLPQFIMEKMPETGFMSGSAAMLFKGNNLFWFAARRSGAVNERRLLKDS